MITRNVLSVAELKSIGFVEIEHPNGESTAMRFKQFTIVLRPMYGLCPAGTILDWVSYSEDFKFSICSHDFSTLKRAVETLCNESWHLGHDAGLEEKAKEIRQCLGI